MIHTTKNDHIHCLISREKLLVVFSSLLRKNHPTKHVVPGFYLCLLMHVMVTSLTVTEGFTQIETTLTLRWMPTYNGKFHVSIGTNWKKMKGSKHRCKKHHKKPTVATREWEDEKTDKENDGHVDEYPVRHSYRKVKLLYMCKFWFQTTKQKII